MVALDKDNADLGMLGDVSPGRLGAQEVKGG
jgi:hypothetical protein